MAAFARFFWLNYGTIVLSFMAALRRSYWGNFRLEFLIQSAFGVSSHTTVCLTYKCMSTFQSFSLDPDMSLSTHTTVCQRVNPSSIQPFNQPFIHTAYIHTPCILNPFIHISTAYTFKQSFTIPINRITITYSRLHTMHIIRNCQWQLYILSPFLAIQTSIYTFRQMSEISNKNIV